MVDQNKALFIVGGPGSGKDFIVKSIMIENNVVELPLDKLYKTIMNKGNIKELNERRAVIVNGNADNLEAIKVSKLVLEHMGYDTAMAYVYTTNKESKARNDLRIMRGSKTFNESTRAKKYQTAIKNIQEFKNNFDTYLQFDNSEDFDLINEESEMRDDLIQLGRGIAEFFNMDENYSASANDDSQELINVQPSNSPTENPQTVIAKTSKKRVGKKSLYPPSSNFDVRLGAVPSGGIGLTSSYVPTKGKTISEIRGRK